MVVFAEVMVALILSAVLLEVYRVLRRRKALSRDAVAMDIFLGIGSVAALVLWTSVLTQTMLG